MATGELYYARAELALALPDHLALRDVPLTPDPLEALANAVADVREDRGESADVMLDLVPVAPNRVSSRRRRLLAQARRNPSDGPAIPGMPQQRTNRFGFDLGAVMSEIASEMKGNQGGGNRQRQHHQQQRTHRVADMKAAMGKLAPGAEPVFSMQLLVRTCARDEYRARMLLDQVLAALEPWSGDNHLRPVGLHLGVTRVRADHWLYRGKFDRRFQTGLFVPRRHSWVTAQEIMRPAQAAHQAQQRPQHHSLGRGRAASMRQPSRRGRDSRACSPSAGCPSPAAASAWPVSR